jgi:hypothetical protein
MLEFILFSWRGGGIRKPVKCAELDVEMPEMYNLF